MWLHRSQHHYRQANPQAWLVQLTRSDEFYRYQFWSDYRWGALVMIFTRSSLYRLPVGAVPVKKPLQLVASDQSCLILEPPPEAFPLVGLLGVLVPVMFLWSCQQPPFSGYQWSPCFDTGTSTRGLSTGVTVGGTGSGLYRLPVGAVPVKKPLQWLPVISPAWSWNLHQRPFHWWDCWGVLVPFMFLWSCQGPPPQWFPVISPVWYWNLHQRPFHWCDCGGTGSSLVQTTGAAAQRVHLPEVAVTIDPYLPNAEFWTGTSPVQATGRVTSQPVMRDTGTSSAQTAGCGHRNPARATG